jgi:hypothetical protein
VPFHPQTGSVLVVLSFAEGWIAVQSGFTTLVFGSAHQVLDKRSEPVDKCQNIHILALNLHLLIS